MWEKLQNQQSSKEQGLGERGMNPPVFKSLLTNLPLGVVEKDHPLKSLFFLLAEICVTEIQPWSYFCLGAF
jgi:hypothetical protein